MSLISGNLMHEFVDSSIPGTGVPLGFVRAYQSQTDFAGALGLGWTHTYEASVLVFQTDFSEGSVDAARVHRADGFENMFHRDAEGHFLPQPGIYESLDQLGPTLYVLPDKQGTKQYFDALYGGPMRGRWRPLPRISTTVSPTDSVRRLAFGRWSPHVTSAAPCPSKAIA